MANFEQLNGDVNNVITSLLSNQNICKLIYHPSDNPLAESDISDTSILMMKHIFPLPKIPDTTSTESAFINVYLNKFRNGGDNKGTKDWFLTFDVIVHNNKWILTDTEMFRPFLILHEIDKLINNRKVVGIKETQFNSGDIVRYNPSFSGYSVSYKAVSVN